MECRTAAITWYRFLLRPRTEAPASSLRSRAELFGATGRQRALALVVLCGLVGGSTACHDRPRPPAEQLTSADTKAPPPLPEVPAPPAAPAQPKRDEVKQPSREGSPKRAGARPSLGTNLEGIADWSPAWAFVDAQKRAREFISATPDTWSDERRLTLDQNRWPRAVAKGQIVRSLVFWGEGVSWPSGKYIVLYDGKGALSYEPQGKLLENRPGRQVVQADPDKGTFGYVITKSDKGDPIRNVRVLMPGGVCEGEQTEWCHEKLPCKGGKKCVPFEKSYRDQLFHPVFLDKIRPFGALRFMDWMATNESQERAWKDRPKPSDAQWRHGAPIEVMVALANRMNQDAWFTMPHAADDDYIRQFATYVREQLKPELKVYVEYSNEVWNGTFPQASYAQEQGKKLNLGQSDWEAQYRYYARRSTEINKIWAAVFAGKRERLVRVVAAQAANLGVAEGILQFEDTSKHVDALAIAPYFGDEYGAPESAGKWQDASVDQLMADLRTHSLPRSIEWIKAHAQLAAKHKIDLIAYEGGQHLVGVGEAMNNEKLNKLFDAANDDPRMKELYLEYLDAWRKEGGKLFMHFNDCGSQSKYGRWGALESLTQTRKQAPKYDALVTYIEKTPRWW
jgi:hypothetical protein